MVLNARTCKTFHRRLFAGEMETITLLKRNDDQQQGTVRSIKLFQCLLPGTKVNGSIIGASKAWYAGEVVEITTMNGACLGATINHPVLTENGFVAAGQLDKNCYLVCDLDNVDFGANPGANDVKDGPVSIEQVFESLLKSGTPDNRWPTVFDFHGDGFSLEGKIDVVRSDRPLRINVISGLLEYVDDFAFNGGSLSSASVGYVDSMGEGFGFAPDGSMSGSCLFHPLFGGHLLPLEKFSLAATASFDPELSQTCSDNSSAGMKISGDSSGRFSRFVPRNDFFPWEIGRRGSVNGSEFASLRPSSEFDSAGDEPVVDCQTTDIELARNLIGGFPGQIAVDPVLKIRRYHYEGPVYDLETTLGYYSGSSTLGNKIFVSNCRRSRIYKTGEPLQGDMNSDHRAVWHIPVVELKRVGVAYLNHLDRIVDKKGRYWETEAGDMIDIKLFETHVDLACQRVDPPAPPGG